VDRLAHGADPLDETFQHIAAADRAGAFELLLVTFPLT
jgi:hypothetical protein